MKLKAIEPEILAVLKASKLTETSLQLPKDMERSLYQKVNKVIELAGGKWNRGAQAHVFPGDPRQILGLALESGRLDVAQAAQVNYAARKQQLEKLQPALQQARGKRQQLKQGQEKGQRLATDAVLMQTFSQIPNFFPTPPGLIATMLDYFVLEPGRTVLEPSAGKGDLADAIKAAGATVHCVEINCMLADYLKSKGHQVLQQDFLEVKPYPVDAILMNPPFERGADARHIQHAFQFLRPWTRLVSVASSVTGEKLKPWLLARGGQVEALPAGTFAKSERSTSVNTCLIIVSRHE